MIVIHFNYIKSQSNTNLLLILANIEENECVTEQQQQQRLFQQPFETPDFMSAWNDNQKAGKVKRYESIIKKIVKLTFSSLL